MDGSSMNEEEAKLREALVAITSELSRLRDTQANVSAQYAAIERLLSEMTHYLSANSESLAAMTKRVLLAATATRIAAIESGIAAVVVSAESAVVAAELSADAALDLWAYSLGIKQAQPLRV